MDSWEKRAEESANRGGQAPAPPAGGFSRLIPADPLERARAFLVEMFGPRAQGSGTRETGGTDGDPSLTLRARTTPMVGGWSLRRWGEQWWRHDGVKYVKVDEEEFKAIVRPWLSSWYVMKEVSVEEKDADGEVVYRADGKPKMKKVKVRCKYVPNERAVNELVHYLQTETYIGGPALSMPLWLAEEFEETEEGGGTWCRCWRCRRRSGVGSVEGVGIEGGGQRIGG